jgi:hypothetical protein
MMVKKKGRKKWDDDRFLKIQSKIGRSLGVDEEKKLWIEFRKRWQRLFTLPHAL